MGRSINTSNSKTTNNFSGTSSTFAGIDQAIPRLVTLHGDVSENSISTVISQLLYLAEIDNVKPIQLIISTYGGSVDEMFALYDVIKCLPCPVHTIALGKVMSAGVLLFAAGTKGHRHVGKNSRFMMHRIVGGSYGSVLENDANNSAMKYQQNLMNKRLREESNLTLKQIKKIMGLGFDHYLSPEEILKYGLGDKLLLDDKFSI